MPSGTRISTSSAAAPVRSLPAPLPPLGGAEMLRVAEIDQRIQVLRGFEDDVAATAAIAAVGAAEFHVLFAAEGDYAVAAVA